MSKTGRLKEPSQPATAYFLQKLQQPLGRGKRGGWWLFVKIQLPRGNNLDLVIGAVQRFQRKVITSASHRKRLVTLVPGKLFWIPFQPGPQSWWERDKITLYTVHCTVYTIHCTVYSVHCTLYTVHCTLYTIQLQSCPWQISLCQLITKVNRGEEGTYWPVAGLHRRQYKWEKTKRILHKINSLYLDIVKRGHSQTRLEREPQMLLKTLNP